MPSHPHGRLQLVLACASLLLAACGAPVPSPAETSNAPVPATTAATSNDAPPSAPRGPSLAPSVTPSAGSAEARYVSQAGGWSVAVPAGWEVEAREDQGSIMLLRDGAIGEIFTSPSSGLAIEELLAQTVELLSTWEGADAPEAAVVRLPAGEAVWATMATRDAYNGSDTGAPATPIDGTITSYQIDDGESWYSISVRGTAANLPEVAKDLAESFAIADSFSPWIAPPVISGGPDACVASKTRPIGPNGLPAWGEEPLYMIGPMAGMNPGPGSVIMVFFRAGGYDGEFLIRGNDAATTQPLRFGYADGGERLTTLPLTAARAQDASDMGPGWVKWEVAMELGSSGCYTVRAAPDGLDVIKITVRFG